MSILWGNDDGDDEGGGGGISMSELKKKRERKAAAKNTFRAEVGRRFGVAGSLVVERVESRLREEVANGIVVSGMEYWAAVRCAVCDRRIEDWAVNWEAFGGEGATCPNKDAHPVWHGEEPLKVDRLTDEAANRPKRSPGRPLKRRGPGETMTVVQVYGTVGLKERVIQRLKPGESVSSWIVGAIERRLLDSEGEDE